MNLERTMVFFRINDIGQPVEFSVVEGQDDTHQALLSFVEKISKMECNHLVLERLICNYRCKTCSESLFLTDRNGK